MVGIHTQHFAYFTWVWGCVKNCVASDLLSTALPHQDPPCDPQPPHALTLKRGSSAQPREYSPLMTPSSMRSSMMISTTAW